MFATTKQKQSQCSSISQVASIEEDKLKIRADYNMIDIEINQQNIREKQCLHQIDLLQKKIKILLESHQEQESKPYTQSLIKAQQEIKDRTNKKKGLVNRKLQLKQIIRNIQAIEGIRDTQNHAENLQQCDQNLNQDYQQIQIQHEKFYKDDSNSDLESQSPQKYTSIEERKLKRIKFQAVCNDLDSKIFQYEDKEKKIQHKISLLKKKAQILSDSYQGQEAKRYIQQSRKAQIEIKSYVVRKKILAQKKFQLEQAFMDMETIYSLSSK